MHHLRFRISFVVPSEPGEGVSLGLPRDAMHCAHLLRRSLADMIFATACAEHEEVWRQCTVVGDKGARQSWVVMALTVTVLSLRVWTSSNLALTWPVAVIMSYIPCQIVDEEGPNEKVIKELIVVVVRVESKWSRPRSTWTTLSLCSADHCHAQ